MEEKKSAESGQFHENEKSFRILKKPEIYSFDELNFIEESLKTFSQIGNISQNEIGFHDETFSQSGNISQNGICSNNELCSQTRNIFQSGAIEKITLLKNAVSEKKDSTAIFFMPDNTFQIFSMIQQYDEICGISLTEIQEIEAVILKAKKTEDELKENRKQSDGKYQKMAEHLAEKLKVLKDFMESGNVIHPVTVQADKFDEV